MMSPTCERAYEDAARYTKALLKFISANDVGLTGGHQYGYYLPKEVWHIFAPEAPKKGANYDHSVTVTWPDGRITNSTVKWYGTNSRSEFRITGFGKDFPYRTFDNLGNLLVLIPTSKNTFNAYVLDLDEDIEELQAALGVEITRSWATYEEGVEQPETEDACLNRKFREFALSMSKLPKGIIFSKTTRDAIVECVPAFGTLVTDDQPRRLSRPRPRSAGGRPQLTRRRSLGHRRRRSCR